MISVPRLSTAITRFSRELRHHKPFPSLLAATSSPLPTPRSLPPLVIYASSFAAATILPIHPTAVSLVHAEAAPVASPIPSVSRPDIVLYQYEVCPFCNKVRAYLDYHGIAYSVIEVDPLRKTELKNLPDTQYRKVPIALINGEQVNGSAAVIDAVCAATGTSKRPSDKERDWLKWLDDTLIHFIAPNIYRTPSESLQTFQYITDNAKFSAWQRGTIRYSGAAAMYMVGRKLKKKYGIEDERGEFASALGDWMEAVREQGGTFFGGERPGMADLSVYGVLKAIQGFDTFAEMVAGNDDLREWFERVRDAVGEEAVLSRA
eukprot:GFKZ01013531.1.p1 GENE.GFKZ01013531.1~~GFKZ01013531.1.p1  ORF type:complete len:319 (+),score=48.14 GFKZ01013531.1:239-1195(+)